MLILLFSLSPCPVKRNVLDIFDIQYISGLNKVKTTSSLTTSCDTASASSEISASKNKVQKLEKNYFPGFYSVTKNSFEKKLFSMIIQGILQAAALQNIFCLKD